MSELFAAIAAGDKAAVDELLERRPELAGERDADGISPVLRALEDGRDDLVDPILDANPPLDVFDAAAVDRTRGLEELLDADANLAHARRPDGATPLHLAARFDRKGAVEVLLQRGADPSARDDRGRTPADVAGDDVRELL